MVPPKPQLKTTYVIDSPLGKLGLVVRDSSVIGIKFLSPKARIYVEKSVVVYKAQGYLKQYFAGMCPRITQYSCYRFSALVGTSLQKKIWWQIQKVPYGRTQTYGKVARAVKTSPRVIGNACRVNPLPIFIPCHRVVAACGIGGYYGKSKRFSAIKKYLLQHEVKPRGN